MKQINIIDYIGNCNENGEATGHVLKTIKEAVNILHEKFEVNLIITEDYKKYFSSEMIKYTVSTSSRVNYINNLCRKIWFRIQKIMTVKKILESESNIWFINTDFYLYIGLAISKNKNNRSVFVTNYFDYSNENGVVGKIKNYFYKVGMKKVTKEFTTNPSLNYGKYEFFPDYAFDFEQYKKYISEKKEKNVYMCGGMNEAKDLEGLIDVFNFNEQSLVVCGNFPSEERFKKLSDKSNSNIIIKNQFLDDEEYYKNISSNKFIVLPYKKEHYYHRSSGVILESIFLGSTVIAPNFVLDFLGVNGIGYDKLEDLKKFKIDDISNERIIEISKKNENILEKYKISSIKEKYIRIFDDYSL